MLSCRFSAGVFSPGLDLINISLQSDSQDVLRLLLPSDAMEEPAAPPLDPRLQLHKLWLEACKSCQHGGLSSIQRFFEAGGAPRFCVLLFGLCLSCWSRCGHRDPDRCDCWLTQISAVDFLEVKRASYVETCLTLSARAKRLLILPSSGTTWPL